MVWYRALRQPCSHSVLLLQLVLIITVKSRHSTMWHCLRTSLLYVTAIQWSTVLMPVCQVCWIFFSFLVPEFFHFHVFQVNLGTCFLLGFLAALYSMETMLWCGDGTDNIVENINVVFVIQIHMLIAISKWMQAVKLCRRRILQFLTGSAG